VAIDPARHRRPALTAAALALLGASFALASTPSWAETAEALRARLRRVRPPAAGRAGLVSGTAEPYLAARRALGRGRPGAALEALSAPHADLFADREALVRGDALFALGETEAAKRAYTRALEAAVVPSVARRAARGLVEVHAREGDVRAALRAVDALLPGARGAEKRRLRLREAELLQAAGRGREALALAQQIRVHAPASRAAKAASRLLRALKKEGLEAPPLSRADRFARLDALLDAGELEAARAALETLDPKRPRTRLARARLLARAGRADEAERALEALSAAEMPDRVAVEALDRLARRKLRADDNEGALVLFDRLRKRAPGTRGARRAEYLAGWIPYDAGRYEEATARMLAYAKRHPKARNRDEALWYAGWASYLGGRAAPARRALRRLVAEHPKSSLVPHAHYWLGRLAEKSGKKSAARAAYRTALERAPLGYYGMWARRRLAALGVKVKRRAPPPGGGAPGSLEAALRALGPERPLSIDRAILLHRAARASRRRGEVQEELLSARRALVRAGDREARLHAADLLHRLGAHDLAFSIALGLTDTGEALAEGATDAWRAWRHAYPRAFEAAVREAVDAHEVAAEMVWSVMRTESHYRPHVVSRVGARGLMQIMPATARHIGQAAEAARAHAARYQTPESNVWLGTWYLNQLLERYDGQVVAAIGAYNGGPSAMDRWLEAFDGMPLDEFVERIPYRETRRYVRRVVETWSIYEQLYGGAAPELPDAIAHVVDTESHASF
jgi:soluble lytic murein transglycosylase